MTTAERQALLQEQVDLLKNTVYSYDGFRAWLHDNVALFDLAGLANEVKRVSSALPKWDDVYFNVTDLECIVPIEIRIDLNKDNLTDTDVRSLLLGRQGSATVCSVTHGWSLNLQDYPFLCIDLYASKRLRIGQGDRHAEDIETILSHVIPTHFPGLTLNKLIDLDGAGLLPEIDGKITAESIGPFLMATRANLLNTQVVIPENIVAPL